jgi:hypothetical protein
MREVGTPGLPPMEIGRYLPGLGLSTSAHK